MNKLLSFSLFFVFIFVGYGQQTPVSEIHTVLNRWHKAAADADFDAYFEEMTPDGVFIGTDATENWQNKAFRAFSCAV